MALSLLESAQLMQNPELRSRVKVACIKFAEYILGEPADTPARSARLRWALSAMSNLDMVTTAALPNTVMDPKVQENGENIDDEGLQSALEAAVIRML
jgi:hypothetical protein